MPTTHSLHSPRRAALCSALVALAAGGACASAQAAPPSSSPLPMPRASAVSVPRSGVLTVPMRCGSAAPVLRVAGTRIAGRCAEGLAARFVLPSSVRGTLRTAAPATVQAGRLVQRLQVTTATRARAAAVSGTWNDATLDCYPAGGGIMGGGTYNNSVHLSLNWHSADSTTFWAHHAVFYEEYWNGAGPYYRTVTGEYSSTTPWSNAYRISPNGVIEWMQSVPTYGFGEVTSLTPYGNDQVYPKSVSIQVRAQVALQTYNGSSWNAPTWRFARPIGAALGYATGICALN